MPCGGGHRGDGRPWAGEAYPVAREQVARAAPDSCPAARSPQWRPAVMAPRPRLAAGRYLDTLHPDSDVHDVMVRMSHDKVRRIPIVDDHWRLVGIISQADVAVKVGPSEPEPVEKVLESISEPARPHR